jgi:hypothetical protein
MALLAAAVADAAALFALSAAITSLAGLKLPDARDLKARSKRAPKYHATPSCKCVSRCQVMVIMCCDLP